MDTKGLLLDDKTDEFEDSTLVDHDSKFVGRVMVLGAAAVVILFALGIFIPANNWSW